MEYVIRKRSFFFTLYVRKNKSTIPPNDLRREDDIIMKRVRCETIEKVSESLILPFTAVYQYGKIGILKIAMTDLHKQSF